MTDSTSLIENVEAIELAHLEMMRSMMFYLYSNKHLLLNKSFVIGALEVWSAIPPSVSKGTLKSCKEEGLITTDKYGRIQIETSKYLDYNWTARANEIRLSCAQTHSRLSRRDKILQNVIHGGRGKKLRNPTNSFIRYRVLLPINNAAEYPIYIAITFKGQFIGETIIHLSPAQMLCFFKTPMHLRDYILSLSGKLHNQAAYNAFGNNYAEIIKAFGDFVNDTNRLPDAILLASWRTLKVSTKDELFNNIINITKGTTYDIYSSDGYIFTDQKSRLKNYPKLRRTTRAYSRI